MRRTRLAIVLATAVGSILLSAAQPPEHADVNHDLHAAALGAWPLAGLVPWHTRAQPASANLVGAGQVR